MPIAEKSYKTFKKVLPLFVVTSLTSISELFDVWVASSFSTDSTAYVGFLYRLFFFYGAFQIAFTSTATIWLNREYANNNLNKFYSYLTLNIVINIFFAVLFFISCISFYDNLFNDFATKNELYFYIYLAWILVISVLSPITYAAIAMGKKVLVMKLGVSVLIAKILITSTLVFTSTLGITSLIIGNIIMVLFNLAYLLIVIFKPISIRTKLHLSLNKAEIVEYFKDSRNILWVLVIGQGLNLLIVSLIKSKTELLAIYSLYFSLSMVLTSLFASYGTYFSLEMAKLSSNYDIDNLKSDIYTNCFIISVIVGFSVLPLFAWFYHSIIDFNKSTLFITFISALTVIVSGSGTLISKSTLRALRYTDKISKIITKSTLFQALLILPLFLFFKHLEKNEFNVIFFSLLFICATYSLCLVISSSIKVNTHRE